MASDKQTVDRIFAAVSSVAEARIKPMFGEYGIYVDEVMIGQINENRLFIKSTPFGDTFAADLERASPYPGAKPAIVVSEEKLDDSAWLREFLSGTRNQLNKPKRK